MGIDRTRSGTMKTDDGHKLPLKSTTVAARIDGPIVDTQVSQTFHNDTPMKIEAVYTFPLPHTGSVYSFHFTIGDRIVRGVIKGKEEARATYERAKSEGKVASLLEQEKDNLFTMSLANINPDATIQVSLSYLEQLAFDSGRYTFTFPMVATDGFGGPHAENIAATRGVPNYMPVVMGVAERAKIEVEVTLNPGFSIWAPECPSHDVKVTGNPTSNIFLVKLNNAAEVPNRDFILRFRPLDADNFRPEFHFQREPGKDGYFLLTLCPPFVAPASRKPVDLCVLLDRSLSMRPSLQQATKALRHLLNGLEARDNLQVYAFDHDIEAVWPARANDWVSASDAQFQTAIDNYLNALQARGGSDLEQAMRVASILPPSVGRRKVVVLITDAAVGNEERLLASMQADKDLARYFVLGVGSACNRYLIDKIVAAGNGAAEVLLPRESDITVTCDVFRARVFAGGPYMTHLAVDWQGAEATLVAPDPIPDLYIGQPIHLLGRFAGSGATTLVLTGVNADGQAFRTDHRVTVPAGECDDCFGIERVWARKRIDVLKDLLTSVPSIDKAIVKRDTLVLSFKYSLMSDYTSFVAVDETEAKLRIALTHPTTGEQLPIFGFKGTDTSRELVERVAYVMDSYPDAVNVFIAGGAQIPSTSAPLSNYASGVVVLAVAEDANVRRIHDQKHVAFEGQVRARAVESRAERDRLAIMQAGREQDSHAIRELTQRHEAMRSARAGEIRLYDPWVVTNHAHPIVLTNSATAYPHSSGNWVCDVCRTNGSPSKRMFHCAQCGWDMCTTCIRNNGGLEVPLESTQVAPQNPYGLHSLGMASPPSAAVHAHSRSRTADVDLFSGTSITDLKKTSPADPFGDMLGATVFPTSSVTSPAAAPLSPPAVVPAASAPRPSMDLLDLGSARGAPVLTPMTPAPVGGFSFGAPTASVPAYPAPAAADPYSMPVPPSASTAAFGAGFGGAPGYGAPAGGAGYGAPAGGAGYGAPAGGAGYGAPAGGAVFNAMPTASGTTSGFGGGSGFGAGAAPAFSFATPTPAPAPAPAAAAPMMMDLLGTATRSADPAPTMGFGPDAYGAPGAGFFSSSAAPAPMIPTTASHSYAPLSLTSAPTFGFGPDASGAPGSGFFSSPAPAPMARMAAAPAPSPFMPQQQGQQASLMERNRDWHARNPLVQPPPLLRGDDNQWLRSLDARIASAKMTLPSRLTKQVYSQEVLDFCRDQPIGRLDLAFVIDETGSMGSQIARVQQEVQNIINDLRASPLCKDLQLALVGFRDHPPQDSSFVSRFIDFTPDATRIQHAVNELAASGGGDFPESLEDGLYDAVRLSWRENSARCLVLIGDAPPHGCMGGSDGFPNGCPLGRHFYREAENLREMGVVAFTVGCNVAGNTETVFRTIADVTRGLFVPLADINMLIPIITGAAESIIDRQRIEAAVRIELQARATFYQGLPDTDLLYDHVFRTLGQGGRLRPRDLVLGPNAGVIFRDLQRQDIEIAIDSLRMNGYTVL